MDHLTDISIKDYTYDLPPGKIAQYPVSKRDESKLLIYKDGKISEDKFFNIATSIDESSLLILNNSKVIKARIIFPSESGKQTEIFCLDSPDENSDINYELESISPVKCKCLIGNLRPLKKGIINIQKSDNSRKISLMAELVDKKEDEFIIEFKWQPEDLKFSEILSFFGKMPLPPYIKREPEEKDNVTYQTTYSEINGSVAAPTAGLHFVESVFNSLRKKNVEIEYITLHVGAGTFLPIKANSIAEHRMHYEYFSVTKKFLERLINIGEQKIITVGTTTLRTIESLYQIGVQIKSKNKIYSELFVVEQWEGYADNELTFHDSVTEVLNFTEQRNIDYLHAKTGLMVIPGYKIKRINGLITNFHQPGSTLLLLVAACVGERWKEIYQYALTHDFRFLSYGDSSILFF